MPDDISRSDQLKRILIDSVVDGRMKIRERSDLEFKKSYSDRNHYTYSKTMTSFANRDGGYIVFGVTDTKREIIGCEDSFDEFKQEVLTSLLNSTYSPEIDWECGEIEIKDKKVWFIYTEESKDKPVVALKEESSAKISSGDIYYRYRAQTTKIKYPELKRIISHNVEMAQNNIMSLLEKIIQKGQTNIGIVNYSDGTFTTPNGVNVSVDKKMIIQVLKRAKYIKKGSFDETKGEPVLRISGDLSIAEEVIVPDLDPKEKYPYLQSQLCRELHLDNVYTIQAFVWKYKLKDSLKFHMEIPTTQNKKSVVHKFSREAIQLLKDEIEKNSSNTNFIPDVVAEYKKDRQRNKKLVRIKHEE